MFNREKLHAWLKSGMPFSLGKNGVPLSLREEMDRLDLRERLGLVPAAPFVSTPCAPEESLAFRNWMSVSHEMPVYDARRLCSIPRDDDWNRYANGPILPEPSFPLPSGIIFDPNAPGAPHPATYGGIQRTPALGAPPRLSTPAPPPPAPRALNVQQILAYRARLMGIQPGERIDAGFAALRHKVDKLEKVAPAKIPAPARRMPDYVHTPTGWRAWDLNGDRLEALGSHHLWKPKEAEQARCTSRAAAFLGAHEGQPLHDAPQKDCTCGWWSFKSLDELMQALETRAEYAKVIGTVEIWGRVIECEHGFRSEFAYPKELWLVTKGTERLSWIYGVPVRRLG